MKIVINGEEVEISGGGNDGLSEDQVNEIVQEATAGKLDKTGGVLGEQEEFLLSSFPIPSPDVPDDPDNPDDPESMEKYRFYLNTSAAGIEHYTPEISAAIELADASVRLYGYGSSSAPIGSELVVNDLEVYAITTGDVGENIETHLTPQDLTISATGEGGTSLLTFDSADGLKVTKCAYPEEDSMPATKGYVDGTVSNMVFGDGVTAIQALTQAEYDASTGKDSTTLYVIKEEA